MNSGVVGAASLYVACFISTLEEMAESDKHVLTQGPRFSDLGRFAWVPKREDLVGLRKVWAIQFYKAVSEVVGNIPDRVLAKIVKRTMECIPHYIVNKEKLRKEVMPSTA